MRFLSVLATESVSFCMRNKRIAIFGSHLMMFSMQLCAIGTEFAYASL